MSDFMTYGKVIEELEKIKKEHELNEDEIKAIDKAIKVLGFSDSFCLI